MTSKNKRYCYKTVIASIATLSLALTQPAIAATGTINFNTVYQQLEGFGGAGAYDAYQLASHADAEEIYDLLFRDLGIDIYRINNTYDYVQDYDYITHTGTIVAAAKDPNRNPDLKILLVPWSPPEYLKSNRNTTAGTLAVDTNDANYPPYFYAYNRYADWWYESIIDDVNGWAGAGITPDYISLQNEPDTVTGYASCMFLATETASYAGYDQAFEAVYNELYDQMEANMPKMIGPETMGFGNSTSYIDALVSLGQTDNIHAFSHHLYSDDPDGGGNYLQPSIYVPAMTTYAADYGDKPLWQTEYAGPGTPDFSHAPLLAQHIYNCLVVEGVTSYIHWSLFRSSSQGGMIRLDTSSTYTIRDIYYWFKHYAYFTDPGWYRVGATTADTNLRMTAFKNPDGDELTIVIANIATSSVSLTLTINNFEYDVSEVYRSSSTLHWSDIGDYTPTMSLPAQSITTIHLVTNLPRLTLSSSDGGDVTTPGEGIFSYIQGTNPTIIATPDPYYHFVEWTGSAVDAGKVGNAGQASTTVIMDANYTVEANFELNNFGYNSSTGRTDKVIINDCYGVPVTFTLTGGGYGEIIGDCDFTEIVLYDTTISSVFTIKTSGSGSQTTVGDITVHGPLNKLTAKTTDLRGDIEIEDTVKSLQLDDALGGNTITIGDTTDPKISTALKFDQVQDLVLESDTPIKSLIVTEWIDDDGGLPDEITAPSIASFQVKGDRRRVLAGDFDADLELTGATVEPTLKSGKIAGALTNICTINGDVGTFAINQLHGDLVVSGSARNIKITEPLALSAEDPSLGSLNIGGYSSITGYKDRIRGTNCTLYSRSSANLYSPAELSRYDILGAWWDYLGQYTAKMSGVTETGSEAIHSEVTDVSGNYYEITSSANGVDLVCQYYVGGDSTSITNWTITDGNTVFDITLAGTLITPVWFQPRTTYKDTGTFTGTFDFFDAEVGDIDGVLTGTTLTNIRLVGHEEITIGLGTFIAAKTQEKLTLKGTINVEYDGNDYAIRFTILSDQYSWSVPDTGIIKYQIRSLKFSFRFPDVGTESIYIKEISEMTNNG